jgi:tRNA pseudouridine13 synthase
VTTMQAAPSAFSVQDWIAACSNLPWAHGAPLASGRLKVVPEDFEVEEELGFEPDGEGEHLFILVEKRGLSTPDAQLHLSRRLRLHPRDIAWSGMKDKQALTRQWFSLHVPGVEPELAACESEQLRILRAVRNSRKLRRGSHAANRFRLRLRDCEGDPAWLTERAALIAAAGVPNYFGPQRFGYDCSSLLQAVEWLEGRSREFKRTRCSMLLSAARSFLFNRVLAARVEQGSWDRVLDGELLALAGSNSVFPATRAAADELACRLAAMDLHPSGPLWGRGELPVSAACAALENSVVAPWLRLAEGLAEQGLQQERRSLRLQVQALQQQLEGQTLQLEFTLAKGSYATSVLRELITTGQS